MTDHLRANHGYTINRKRVRLELYSKRPEWTQPENLDALFIGISEIVDNSKPEIV
jgi:hypothetical protein